ncbi:hypothetical protein HNV11_22710 [Spirosoma taeanense]|uniref:Uncharacterized protein n=1 Tax=Spirosoma taeanense TaxID=2735870 RepID=A0A6M5YFE8_9BACT|nr:hypothetical protein [Spirosoma taeanense]QJW91991.1 hypothetical protein HNV11_22710 [Spirosoma taeanense]
MEDPKVPFADTTARRAQLMAATERFKNSISTSVESMKDDAAETGKTAAFVAGAALAVYLVVNAILPKSDEYRHAEKYGEPDEEDYDDLDEDDEDDSYAPPTNRKVVKQQAKKTQRKAAASGLIGGLITSVLTNIAREQLSGFLARIRTNNAINPAARPTQYHEKAQVRPADYTSQQ